MHIQTAQFKSLVSVAQIFVLPNPLKAILENILLESDGKRLTVGAMSEDGGILLNAAITTPENFSIAVPARILFDTIKQIVDASVDLVVDQDKATLTIHTSNGKFKIACEAGGNFPRFPKQPEQFCEVESAAISQVIHSGLPICGTDEFRVAMNGIQFNNDPGSGLTAYVTDGFRCLQVQQKNLTGLQDNFVLHRKPATKIIQILPETGLISIGVSDHKLFFRTDTMMVFGQTIAENFPACAPFFSKPIGSNSLIVKKQSLLSSLKRSAIYTDKLHSMVSLSLLGQQLGITAKGGDDTRGFEEVLPVTYMGEDMSIGFNARLLSEFLDVFTGDELTLTFQSPDAPVYIVEAESGLAGLIMPVRMN